MVYTTDSVILPTASFERQREDEWLRPVLYRIRLCFLPIIVAGTITNCLNFIVLSRREMRTVSTSVYLFALAVADLGVMYFELFRVWFEWSRFIEPERFITDSYCRAANFANGVARDYANWLIACLTLERVVRIASPYGARAYCTPRRARSVIVGLFAAICLPHVHALVFSRAQKRTDWVCWEDPESTAGWIIAGLVEFVVGYIVVIVVFVLNLILTCMIYRNRLPSTGGGSSSLATQNAGNLSHSPSTVGGAAGLTSSNSYGGGCGGGMMSIQLQRGSADVSRRSQNRRLTRTLVGVAVVFLVCETPRMITSVICKFERTPFRRILLNASFVLSGINHAANFFIYIISSPRFRQLFFESLQRSSQRPGRAIRPALGRCCCHRHTELVGGANVNIPVPLTTLGGAMARLNEANRLVPKSKIVITDVDDPSPNANIQAGIKALPLPRSVNAGIEDTPDDGLDGNAPGTSRSGSASGGSKGMESNSGGDIYVQINLQVFFSNGSNDS